MSRTLAIAAGVSAIGCFVAERYLFYRAWGSSYAFYRPELEAAFFILFGFQVLLHSAVFLREPDNHVHGVALPVLFFSILLFILAIQTYHVILRLCNFLVLKADPVLP